MSWSNVAASASQKKVKQPITKQPATKQPVTKKTTSVTTAKQAYIDATLKKMETLNFKLLERIRFNSEFIPDEEGCFWGWDLSSFQVERVVRIADQLILTSGQHTVRLTATASRKSSYPYIDETLDVKGDVITYIIEQPLTGEDRLRIQNYNLSGRGESNMALKKYAMHFDDDTFEIFFAVTKYAYNDAATLVVDHAYE